MKKKFALSRSVLGIVSALCIGLFCAQLTTASADEPSRASNEAGAVDSASDAKNGDGTSSARSKRARSVKVKQVPATSSAVPATAGEVARAPELVRMPRSQAPLPQLGPVWQVPRRSRCSLIIPPMRSFLYREQTR